MEKSRWHLLRTCSVLPLSHSFLYLLSVGRHHHVARRTRATSVIPCLKGERKMTVHVPARCHRRACFVHQAAGGKHP
jgi:hypothetical protein